MSLASFHPTVQRWFSERLGPPSEPQMQAWPKIEAGRHVLVAAPTGSGKTLAGFLWAVDGLLREGDALEAGTRVVYVSPLKALSNDIEKNLTGPLTELRALDPALPDVRVLVRTGDTPQSARQRMRKNPPHILVTTPESLYILLTSAGGRAMLGGVRTVIVDEIHALAGNKRGSHLSLSLERLEQVVGRPVQRIGLSATVQPLDEVARFLVGPERTCDTVDAGHLRRLDLAIELPDSPLETVCPHEVWAEIYQRMAGLIEAHRTTLVFVNTRKLAERVSARLTDTLGAERVTSHHGSLSKERRLDAERRLKAGGLSALVATASMELGIDIGDVDLVIQVGVPPAISTFLQRVGRSGHGAHRVPKGRLFPLTPDELVCSVALLRAVLRGELDPVLIPEGPLDVLAQQLVATCEQGPQDLDALYSQARRAWPYRALGREDFDQVVALHVGERLSLLHEDAVTGSLLPTKRTRLTAVTSGGAIPDNADYRVVQEPEGTHVGSVHEDFAIEGNAGDIFQLGNASWRILKVEPGIVRVADAEGLPPTLPFWIAEGPSRTRELSAAVAAVRELGGAASKDLEGGAVPAAAAEQLDEFLVAGREVLGCVPTQRRVVAERFFDETGGMQLVIHSPFGGRINRAWGLALRKVFCRSFGFELQAAANEEAILLSLGPQHSFPLADVFGYLHPDTVRDKLVQATLASPMFEARWRYNATASLLLPRFRGGRRTPMPLQRMKANDLLAAAFPEVLACGETLPGGDLPVPWEHPLVRQTLLDCLHEAMDVDGLIGVLRDIRGGAIETVAVDAPQPSAFAASILNAMPYAFLDDAPLEERRTQAVVNRRALDRRRADDLGDLDPLAVARVRAEAWPDPEGPEELHEALCWMGYLTDAEIAAGPLAPPPPEAPPVATGDDWRAWIHTLHDAGRVVRDGDRWFAVEAPREPKVVLRGRMEALGPIHGDDPSLAVLEAEGPILRVRLGGAEAWCDRRLLARIHRLTLDSLRQAIAPVTAADFLRFLRRWQRAEPGHQRTGPAGILATLDQLAGYELPAAAWEKEVLPLRVADFRSDWLDQLCLSGQVAWGRLWGGGATPARTTPLCFVPRADLPVWLGLAPLPDEAAVGAHGAEVLAALRRLGPSFSADLQAASGRLPDHFEMGLKALIGHGLITCDAFAGVRRLLIPPSRRKRYQRRGALTPPGRWAMLRREGFEAPPIEFLAERLLRRWGVVFRRMLERERLPVPWRDLHRCYRRMELRGEVHGGRFVAGFAGEQFALPEAVTLLRKVRREGAGAPLEVSPADPLNLEGILTPRPRVSPQSKERVRIA